MRTLFVMDPLDRINVAGDSTYMMMLEAAARGWPVSYCVPDDLYAEGGVARARVGDVRVQRGALPFEVLRREDRALGDFDVVWMRKDPPFDMEYIFATYLLDLVPPTTLVLNRPSSLRNCNEKLFTLEFAEFITPTLITRDVARGRAFAEAAPDRIVIKPWDGNGGRGVLVSHKGDPNLRSMLEILTGEGKQACIIQHYVPEIVQGDKRVILVDGEPVGWMLRVPSAGDHRGNMHAGARVAACELTERDREVCARIGPKLRELGLLFVGIDLIGPALTEINVTSPTGIQEINALMGLRLEVTLTDAVEARLIAHRAQAGGAGVQG